MMRKKELRQIADNALSSLGAIFYNNDMDLKTSVAFYEQLKLSIDDAIKDLKAEGEAA